MNIPVPDILQCSSTLFLPVTIHLITFLFNSPFIDSIATGELVNTSDNAVLCYSCMATPPMYANVNTTRLVDYLLIEGVNDKTNRPMTMPTVSAGCRETHVTAQGQFLDTTKYICETGACVKLKGYLQGEAFVIRECWDRLWDRHRDQNWQGCAPLSFFADTNTEICVCSVDLCNGANIQKISFTILSTFGVSVYATMLYK